MRLDKYISTALIISRKDATALIKRGRVAKNGLCISNPSAHIDEKADNITFDGSPVTYSEFIYIMLNKPAGVISATDDVREKTVLSLLPENYATKGLFPVGRLDKDTVGLLILTNDGKNAHKLLSPKYCVEKTYYVECDGEFTEEDIENCKKGVMLSDGMTRPSILEILEDRKRAHITLTEGRFHEVKRICAAFEKKVLFLERVRFGSILLDENLPRGSWRNMSDEEIKLLLSEVN